MIKAKPEDHIRLYLDYVRDLRGDEQYPCISIARQYEGDPVIKLAPTQHGISASKQKKRTDEFIEFLYSDPPIVEMQVVTLATQKVFDAICNLKKLESLRLKWFRGKDLSKITQLTSLKKLFIENGSSVADISPLAEMEQLETLILGNTVKIHDYSCLEKLQNLKVLGICKYQSDYSSSRIKIVSDDFVDHMPSLEWVDLNDCRICKDIDTYTY